MFGLASFLNSYLRMEAKISMLDARYEYNSAKIWLIELTRGRHGIKDMRGKQHSLYVLALFHVSEQHNPFWS